jgi:hypothetical protein
MSHWYVQGRLGQEHRADLDREADRASLSKAVRVGTGATRRKGVLDAAIGLVARLQRRARTIGHRTERPQLELERDV